MTGDRSPYVYLAMVLPLLAATPHTGSTSTGHSDAPEIRSAGAHASGSGQDAR